MNNDKQSITFIEPHGLGRETITSPKVQLTSEISSKVADSHCSLNAFILSPTPYAAMVDTTISEAEWNAANVLFMERDGYIEEVFTERSINVENSRIEGKNQ